MRYSIWCMTVGHVCPCMYYSFDKGHTADTYLKLCSTSKQTCSTKLCHNLGYLHNFRARYLGLLKVHLKQCVPVFCSVCSKSYTKVKTRLYSYNYQGPTQGDVTWPSLSYVSDLSTAQRRTYPDRLHGKDCYTQHSHIHLSIRLQRFYRAKYGVWTQHEGSTSRNMALTSLYILFKFFMWGHVCRSDMTYSHVDKVSKAIKQWHKQHNTEMLYRKWERFYLCSIWLEK